MADVNLNLQRNFFKDFMSRLKAATDISHMEGDIKRVEGDLEKIEKHINQGDAKKLHKDYRDISKRISDFRKNLHKLLIMAFTLENALVIDVMPKIDAALDEAAKKSEPQKAISIDRETVLKPLKEMNEEQIDLKQVVANIHRKIEVEIKEIST